MPATNIKAPGPVQQGDQVAEAWLRALQLSQVAFDRWGRVTVSGLWDLAPLVGGSRCDGAAVLAHTAMPAQQWRVSNRNHPPTDCAALPACRLLDDLSQVQRNLRFWRARLRAGAHGAFMLLSRGPSAFVVDLLAAIRAGAPHAAASDKIEERVSGRLWASGVLRCGLGD